MHIHYDVEKDKRYLTFAIPIQNIVIVILLISSYFGYLEYDKYQKSFDNTLPIISSPRINDIYFLDYRMFSQDLRPTENYRIAKVAEITGDLVTLVYGAYFYDRKDMALNGVKYGQLSYDGYFQPTRYETHRDTIKDLHKSGAIYYAERPVNKRLYGHAIESNKERQYANLFIPGKQDSLKGEDFLLKPYSESNVKAAYELFTKSANDGYDTGQINLGEMYINGTYVEKDLDQALYWFKQASLQSSKRAILKYGIICKQVADCDIEAFYNELITSGVNMEVRDLGIKSEELKTLDQHAIN